MFLENVAQLIVGIAWPAVILVLALMLRKPIVGLLPRIRSVEGPGIKLLLDRLEKGRSTSIWLASGIIWPNFP